jgi:outer membrane receptor protein involved in Fe transport
MTGCRLLRLLAIAVLLAAGSIAAARAAVLSLRIPAQPVAQALESLSQQTGIQFAYVSRVVDRQRSHAVAAGLDVDAALTRMLQGTGLGFEHLTDKTVHIFAVTLQAQTPPAAALPDEAESPTEIVITGSRIPQASSSAPAGLVQVVTAKDILLTGHSDAADVIGELPQSITSASVDYGNFSTMGPIGGVSTADLRGLGPQRTVVLINGRRLGVGDPNTANASPGPDLDQVPLAMIERVEILTGGASATYGADAVAGVVNFILKDNVQGVQVDGRYGFTQHTQQNHYIQEQERASGTTPPVGTRVDGFKRDVSVLAGTAFLGGAGQLTGYVSFHRQSPVHGSDRDFAACAAVSNSLFSGVPTDPGYTCDGSDSSNHFVALSSNGLDYSVQGNQFVPGPAAGTMPPAVFNFAPYVSLVRQDRRYQAGLLAHFDLAPTAKPYLEFNFMDDRTELDFAPSGLFLSDNAHNADRAYRVNCSNPLLSAQEADILCSAAQIAADQSNPGSISADVDIGRRNIEGRGRAVVYRHQNYRAVVGARGKLGDAWNYNAYALYSYTSLGQTNLNYLSYFAIDNALQVTTDASGRPVCISGGACVPYNIFNSGAVTADQLANLYTSAIAGGSNGEQILAADLTGQLAGHGVITPWARQGVALNVGAEHRGDTLRFAPDSIEHTGDLAGFATAAVDIDRQVAVNDGFVEIHVPIAQQRKRIADLAFSGGYRYSDYSSTHTTHTYRLDLQYSPAADLRLHASYDRVVRVPNLVELYTPASIPTSSDVFRDPCAPTQGGAVPAVASLEACMRTGVTAAQYGNGLGPAFGGTNLIAQCVAGCGQVDGGNSALLAETARTWSLGMSYSAPGLPAFSGDIDYFHIAIDGEIGKVPPSITFRQCIATGDPTWCSQIMRTPTGSLNGSSVDGGGYIKHTNVNTGAALVSGIDVHLAFVQPLRSGWGKLTARLNGSWLEHEATTPYQSAPSYDCAGLFGATCLGGSVSPRWRHNLRLSWETPWDLQFSVQWRFIGRTGFDNNSTQNALQYQEEGFYDPLLTHIPNYSYFDLTALWAANAHLQLRTGVANLFDKDPPFIPYQASSAAGAINTFPTYDILGRDIYLALRATF